MTDPTFPLFPLLSLLGFIISLIPLPWHLHAWNSGTCYFMMWSAVACLNRFINSVVWVGNAIDSAPALCEISTRITIGASVGIPAASLCINRRLYMIASVQAVSVTKAEKRRALIVDTFICVLLPIVCIALAYIVQGHRYDIFEDLGCHPAIYNTLPAYFLVYMWPVVIGLVSAVYCVMSLRALIRRQIQFNQYLSSCPSITSGRYFRLMALALTDLVLTVPFGIYGIYSNAAYGDVQPWRGWADAHYDFSRVDSIPASLWRSQRIVAIPMELTRWIVPACAFIFFAYFGFAEEARRNYSAAYRAVVSRLSCLKRSKPLAPSAVYMQSSEEHLPPYPSAPVWSKRLPKIESTSLEPSSPIVHEIKADDLASFLTEGSLSMYSADDHAHVGYAV